MKTYSLRNMRRFVSWLLLFALLAGFSLFQLPIRSEAKNYGQYKDVAKVYDQGSCPSMQGMSVCGNYIYACKINGNTDKEAVVARVNNDSSSSSYGTVSFLTNSASGTKYFSDFGHGNDIEVENINGITTLFVPTSTSGSGSLVRYQISGTTATKVGSYTMTNGGTNLSGGAIRVTHFDASSITFLFKSGKVCYTGTLPISQTSGTLEMTKLCTLDYTTAYVNGTAKDTSKYSLQGMGYYDYKLYLPLSGHTVSGHENISIILVYDLEGASGTIKPDPNLTFCITSSAYSAYFEVESCEISPKDGRMYFSANRRVSSSDTNHDGVSYISNWTYDPSTRPGTAKNYRWELRNNELISTTDGGNVYNGIHQMEGSISNGIITNGRFVLSKPVILNHDQPWILEWKSSGSGSAAMLFASETESKRTDKPYIFRRAGSSLISIGAHNGSSYNNYGLDLADYGVDSTAAHIYRMTNKIASDGSNMIYLSVDGRELGALNQHYVGATSQNKTSDWVSGKDLKFSYLGTLSYKISDCKIDYIQVWHGGLSTAADEPNTYRWEGGMSSLTTFGLTENVASLVSGTVSGSSYTDCRYDLERDIVLMHDLPWVLEWDSSGTWSTGILLAADHMSNTYHAPYLFRGASVIAIGYHDGSKHTQWGVKLSDYGISLTDEHCYALKNLLNDDGSNMVWLYVDGVKTAPMNTYCTGGSATATQSDELSGQDFVFSHIGTFQHDLTGSMNHLQVWEAGIPAESSAHTYRWETHADTLSNVTNAGYHSNPISYIKGSCTSGIYTGSQYMLDKPVYLLHDRNWRLQWQCEGKWDGGGFLLSSALSGNTANNVYIFRNSKTIAIGMYTGTRHEQWGVCPGDYGIDHNAPHTYTLSNEINTDGSNMIWLYVDGAKIAPMTSVFISGTPNGTTSDWVSGKDFVFSYVGSREYTLNNTTMTYLEVMEGCIHSYSNWTVTQQATCVTAGTKTQNCTLCGNVQIESMAPLGHEYTITVTAPTCITEGCTTYTCQNCGDNYQSDIVKAYGHNHKATVIEPNCNNPGYTTYTCHCGDSYVSDEVAALGHSYETVTVDATCTEDGSVTKTCTNCGDTQVTAISAKGHSFTDGICGSCGAADPDYVKPVVTPTLTLKAPTLEFKDMITVNAMFTAENTEDVVEMGMITYTEKVGQWSVETAAHVIPGTTYDETTGRYIAVSQGIHAKYLGDTVYLAVYAKLTDGSYVYTKLAGYSPVQYATSKLKGTDTKLKQLVVAMLNYGAAAQTHFQHNVENLANSTLTAEQIALPEAYRSDMVSTVASPSTEKQGTFTNNKGFAKKYPSISFEGAFCINYFFTPNYAPVDGITLYYWNAADYEAAEVLSVENATGSFKLAGSGTGEYSGNIEGIAAKSLSEATYVAAVYSDGTTEWTSGVLGYSIGAYCASQSTKGGTIADLAMATAVYGYQAKQYFA